MPLLRSQFLSNCLQSEPRLSTTAWRSDMASASCRQHKDPTWGMFLPLPNTHCAILWLARSTVLSPSPPSLHMQLGGLDGQDKGSCLCQSIGKYQAGSACLCVSMRNCDPGKCHFQSPPNPTQTLGDALRCISPCHLCHARICSAGLRSHMWLHSNTICAGFFASGMEECHG